MINVDELKFEYNGKSGWLNDKLIKQQGVSPASVYLLLESHVDRLKIFEKMENTDDPTELKAFAKEFDDLEFRQQELWRFPKDPNFHRWFDVPKCTCPFLDNMGYIGTKYRIYDHMCPIHGNGTEQVQYVKLMSDYTSSGVWNGMGVNIELDSLPLSVTLKTEIDNWQANYDQNNTDWNPEPDQAPEFDMEAHVSVGLKLAIKIKRELPDWTVVYYDELKSDDHLLEITEQMVLDANE